MPKKAQRGRGLPFEKRRDRTTHEERSTASSASTHDRAVTAVAAEPVETIDLTDLPPTRQQRAMAEAYRAIHELPDKKELRTIYGGLCHQVPIWVRAQGLAQAVAFIREKGHPDDQKSDRATAYRFMERHLAAALGVKVSEQAVGNSGALLDRVMTANVITYIQDTRTILDAWVYYKRFAASVLGVENAHSAEVSDAAAG